MIVSFYQNRIDEIFNDNRGEIIMHNLNRYDKIQ